MSERFKETQKLPASHLGALLERAWRFREQRGILKESNAVRIFHGPGEGQGPLGFIAIDRFVDSFVGGWSNEENAHYWLTEWEGKEAAQVSDTVRTEIIEFLRSKGALSVVGLSRPEQGVAPVSQVLWGEAPQRIRVREAWGGQFWIQLTETRHPGLFLDHEPLRQWLHARMKNLRVLNTFAYTGSLSVAAALGGAPHVTTLDLSKPSLEWAKENFTLNRLPIESHRWIFGDVFEWLPRLKREKQTFDCVILDPPSFSRSKKKQFSTGKDLLELHALAMDLLNPEGFLITSINSANIPSKKFETDVLNAARTKKMNFRVCSPIHLPETFPTPLGATELQYLKGWILKVN